MIFILAPMDDVTDTVFRRIVLDCAPPDLLFTEFVNVDGLQSPGREKLLPKLKFDKSEKPIVAQIWGKKPENYEKTAHELVEMGFDGIDINMGCPDKTVVKNGGCSALINNRELAVEIIKATQCGAAGRVPVSVKTRLGFNSVDFSWHELLLQQGLDMLTVHGRTRKEMSLVPARWEDIAKVRELRDKVAKNTKIIGNGDITSRARGKELAEKYQLDGVMIGRGIFHDPFIFAEHSPWLDWTPVQKVELYKKHVQLFKDTWPEGQRKIAPLAKFCKIYINGFDNAKEVREALMGTKNLDELTELINQTLEKMQLSTVIVV